MNTVWEVCAPGPLATVAWQVGVQSPCEVPANICAQAGAKSFCVDLVGGCLRKSVHAGVETFCAELVGSACENLRTAMADCAPGPTIFAKMALLQGMGDGEEIF